MYSGIASDMEFVEGWFMVFNATFNDISVTSWRSVLLVQETGVLGENQ
jgi:hypothetical protein